MTGTTFMRGGFDVNVSKIRSCGLIAVVLLVAGPSYAQAPVGTAFTYQGQLKDGGMPADGDYDFVFRLYDADTGGAQVGGDVTVDAWPVVDGLFTLQLDFGGAALNGDARWLEIQVRGAGQVDYETLSPRQPLNAAPYALYALDGPGGAGGYWAANGVNIYNTNSGNVGLGTNSPLEKLHVAGPAANLRVQDDDDPDSYAVIKDTGAVQVCFEKHTSNGSTLMDLTPMPLDGVSGAAIRLFRTTNTTGDKHVYFYRGNNTTSTSAAIGVDGADSYFQIHGGKIGIGTTSPTFKLDVRETDPSVAAAISGYHTNGYGVKGSSDSGYGVFGASGDIGVYGYAMGADSIGVFGISLGENGYAGYFNGRGYFAADVGIRVENPQAALDVVSWNTYPAVKGVSAGTGVYGLHDESSGTLPGVWGETNSSSDGAAGVRGYNNSASSWGGYGVHGSHAGYGIGVYGVSANGTGVYAESGGSGFGVYAKSASGCALYAETENGTTAAHFVGNVEIESPSTGEILIELGEGLDYAEGFDVSDEREITPGTVLVIDAENAGQLAISSAPYDRKVAGIVAGANGLGSAVRLGAGQYDFDVALAGRVYCNVDATYGAIQPGDLLTTSPTPGYAMKVTDHEQAQGAILGKAMQPLKQGEKGQILVLVTLQ
jgi:hypothetical protein